MPRVGLRLQKEALKTAPRDLGSAERLVLSVIAGDANEKTGISAPGMKFLEEATGLEPRWLRRSLNRLVERGLVERMSTGTDHRGQEVVANKGHRTRYRLPKLARKGGSIDPPLEPPKGGAGDPPLQMQTRRSEDRFADAKEGL